MSGVNLVWGEWWFVFGWGVCVGVGGGGCVGAEEFVLRVLGYGAGVAGAVGLSVLCVCWVVWCGVLVGLWLLGVLVVFCC
ncbi:hypothetical protein ACTHT5_11305, partial [Neisseria sp. P0022.S002]